MDNYEAGRKKPQRTQGPLHPSTHGLGPNERSSEVLESRAELGIARVARGRWRGGRASKRADRRAGG